MEKSKEKLQQLYEDAKFVIENKAEGVEEDLNWKYDLEEIEYNSSPVNKSKSKRKLINIKVNPKVLAGISITSLAVVLASGIIKDVKAHPDLTKEEKFVYEMAIESEIHGGKKNTIDDEYIYDLEKHLESGDCLIQGDGFIRNRIIDTCVEHELSEEVTESIVNKFDLNYNNKYKEAEEIDPLKIYQEEQKELKEQNNSYGM